jgi:hypothetical protein
LGIPNRFNRKSSRFSLQTYITHPWVVAKNSDACEAIYMPTPAVQNIEIDN